MKLQLHLLLLSCLIIGGCGNQCNGGCNEYRKLSKLDDATLEAQFSSLGPEMKLGVFAWSQNNVEPPDARFFFLLLKEGGSLKEPMLVAAKNGIGDNATVQLISAINILSKTGKVALTGAEIEVLRKACADHSSSKKTCLGYVDGIKKN